MEKIDVNKSWFFETVKIKKFSKLSKEREETQISRVRNERRAIKITDLADMKGKIGKYNQKLCIHKINNLDEMKQFLKNCQVPKLTQDETKDLRSSITLKEIEVLVKNLTKQEIARPRWLR